jgi:hypothetical protein
MQWKGIEAMCMYIIILPIGRVCEKAGDCNEIY